MIVGKASDDMRWVSGDSEGWTMMDSNSMQHLSTVFDSPKLCEL